ncbi:hypothetical protein [Bacillus inaquosorum]|uniref:hypothetical protein n=1 Tax=Bacillus inaquosorum TaxID=483913 RepID=UPI00227FEEA7|nr:hypothetical protein [Bacillus inaquosorum]MCY7768119.1 hypothetical protein [Bacillus inaquosorum]MCY9099515.1 hypothetical protein [Bacillus inaquosorum]
MLQIIDPTKHSFYFNLTRIECYYLRSGKCSLDLTDEEFNMLEGEELKKADKCRRIAANFIKPNMEEKDSGVDIQTNACGHTTFNDGQHRMCICKKSGVTKLKVTLSDNGNNICKICKDRKRQLTLKDKIIKKVFKIEPRKFARSKDFIDDEKFK